MEFISLAEQDFFFIFSEQDFFFIFSLVLRTRESTCITREINSKLMVKPFEYSLYFFSNECGSKLGPHQYLFQVSNLFNKSIIYIIYQ